MTSINPIKNQIENIFSNCFKKFSIERKLNDDQMECMQFGICDYAQR